MIRFPSRYYPYDLGLGGEPVLQPGAVHPGALSTAPITNPLPRWEPPPEMAPHGGTAPMHGIPIGHESWQTIFTVRIIDANQEKRAPANAWTEGPWNDVVGVLCNNTSLEITWSDSVATVTKQGFEANAELSLKVLGASLGWSRESSISQEEKIEAPVPPRTRALLRAQNTYDVLDVESTIQWKAYMPSRGRRLRDWVHVDQRVDRGLFWNYRGREVGSEGGSAWFADSSSPCSLARCS